MQGGVVASCDVSYVSIVAVVLCQQSVAAKRRRTVKEVEDKEGNDVDEVDGGDVVVTTTELTDTSQVEMVSIQGW